MTGCCDGDRYCADCCIKALSRLGDHAFRRAAQEQAARALKRAQAGLVIEDDKARLEAIVMTK